MTAPGLPDICLVPGLNTLLVLVHSPCCPLVPLQDMPPFPRAISELLLLDRNLTRPSIQGGPCRSLHCLIVQPSGSAICDGALIGVYEYPQSTQAVVYEVVCQTSRAQRSIIYHLCQATDLVTLVVGNAQKRRAPCPGSHCALGGTANKCHHGYSTRTLLHDVDKTNCTADNAPADQSSGPSGPSLGCVPCLSASLPGRRSALAGSEHSIVVETKPTSADISAVLVSTLITDRSEVWNNNNGPALCKVRPSFGMVGVIIHCTALTASASQSERLVDGEQLGDQGDQGELRRATTTMTTSAGAAVLMP